MNGSKAIAGFLMLIVGIFLSAIIVLNNIGHMSSGISTGEFILYTTGALLLLAGGIYAVWTAGRSK